MPTQMNALVRLFLGSNQISSFNGMPENVLNSRAYIHITSNPLSPETITAINQGHYQADIAFDMAAHEIAHIDINSKPLDQEVGAWFSKMDTSQWKEYAMRTEGKALATLLMRLHGCASFQGGDKTASRNDLQAILERMLTDKTFRTYCFTAAQGSDANCHDNVQAIFDDLRMQLANPALQHGATLKEVVAFQRGQLAATLIDKYVAKHLPNGDLLESGQELKRLLSGDPALQLPIQFKDIKYAQTGVISNDREGYTTLAKNYVLSRRTPARLAQHMADDDTCADFLKKSYAVTFEAHNQLWADALAQASKNTMAIENKNKDPLTEARNSQLGDGKQFQALQERAVKDLLKEIALHAQTALTMTTAERQIWEIKRLLNNPDWVAYLNKQPRDPATTNEQDELISRSTDGELVARTHKALKEGSIEVFEVHSVRLPTPRHYPASSLPR